MIIIETNYGKCYLPIFKLISFLCPRPRIVGIIVILMAGFFLSGCQTTKQVQAPQESREDVEKILSTVAGALSGKTLSEEELHNLEKQIRTDKEAQTAVQQITDSVGGKAPIVKYCPVTGQRYAGHLKICPEHRVPLEVVSP